MTEAERKREYRKAHRTFSLSFTNAEAQRIAQHVASKGYRVPDYLKQLLRIDMGEGVNYVVPNDGRLQEMALHFRRIGVNINQCVHHVNATREFTKDDLRRLQKHLMELETVVLDSIRKPKDIITVVSKHLQAYPNDRIHLIQWLYDHQAD